MLEQFGKIFDGFWEDLGMFFFFFEVLEGTVSLSQKRQIFKVFGEI